jgi:hypothetical protein
MILAGLLVLAGCTRPVDTAVMPPATGLSSPTNAVQYANWAFSSPARTQNDPVSAARSVAALDYAAGAVNTDPGWSFVSSVITSQMLDARLAVRRVLGIPPDTPSQAVVNSMIAVSSDLAQGNRAAALQTLNAPIFTLGPEKTLALLTNMPRVREANIATAQAEGALNGTFCPFGCASSGF